jgi:hypothetical protein
MKMPAVGQARSLQAASQAACLLSRHSRMIFYGAEERRSSFRLLR